MRMRRPILILLVLTQMAFVTTVFADSPLKAGDRIRVWVKGEPELTVERVIGFDGGISYPLIGNIGVAGLRAHEAARLISATLNDGYLVEPMVQVTVISRAQQAQVPAVRQVPTATDQVRTRAEPLTTRTATVEPFTVLIVNGRNGQGVDRAAILLGDKVYQTNRLGQAIFQQNTGRITIVADGYKVLQGALQDFLKPGTPPFIVLDEIDYPEIITIQVVDHHTRAPLSGVEIELDSKKVTTNNAGRFRVKRISREYGELQMRKAGYRDQTKVVDFKGPPNQIIPMIRNQ